MNDGVKKTENISLIRKRARSSPEERDKHMSKKVGISVREMELGGVNELLITKINEMSSILSNVATKEDINKIDDKLNSMMKENVRLKIEVTEVKRENSELKKSVNFLMRNLKQKNLIIHGLKELKEEEDKGAIFKNLCVRSLGIAEPQIDRVVTIAKGKALLVELVKKSEVQSVLRNAKKLKGTGIWINKDLTYHDRQIRKKLFESKKKICEVDKAEKVLIRDGYMLFRGIKFSWNEDHGFTSANKEDVEMLNDCLRKYEELKN